MTPPPTSAARSEISDPSDDLPAATGTETPDKSDRYVVPGLERGLRMLQLFDLDRRVMTLTEMTRQLGVSPSTTFRLAYTLEKMGFLDRDRTGKTYRLGSRVLGLGFEYLASMDVADVARPELEILRDETGASAHLSVRDGCDILYLNRVPTRHHITSNFSIGARRPAYATPMGRLLLSELGREDLERLYGRTPLRAYTDQTPRTLDKLHERTQGDRQRGFVVSRGSYEPGGCSVAAPVRGADGTIIAAIDISGPNAAFDFSEIDNRLKDLVVSTASRISRRLGYRGPE
jgi:DNA-binding IclR family transcriptional regulator